MSDKERLSALEECLSEDHLKKLKKIKKGLTVAVYALGGCSVLEGGALALLLYKLFC